MAEQLGALNVKYNFALMGPLLFKTDLHNTWWRNVSALEDGYHELLEQQNWIYKYQGGKLLVNAVIEALHRALEDPPEDIDPESLRSSGRCFQRSFSREKESKEKIVRSNE